MPLNVLTLQSIVKALKVLIDFVIVWVLIYYVLKVVRNNSRTVQIFKGVVLVVLIRFLAYYFGLSVLLALADFVIQYGVIIFAIIFQQEIRSILERLGKSTVFSALHTLSGNERERLVNELVNASVTLSERRTGALITMEQGHSLVDYIKTGTPINSSVTADLLTSIFVTTTPLHDGAVIIQGDRIACASAYFPPTSIDLPTRYGARHRAAIGISEITDSVTIVISEETGTISIAENGKLTTMDEYSLREYLNLLIQHAEKEVSQRIETRVTRKINLSRFNVDPIRIEKVEDEVPMPTPTKSVTKKEVSEKKGFFAKRKEKKETKRLEKETKQQEKKALQAERKSKKKKQPVVKADVDSLKSATTRSENEEHTDTGPVDRWNGGDNDAE